VSLLFFVAMCVAAVAGSATASENLASVVLFIWFWVGLVIVHALFGNWWATLSPFDTLARLLALGDEPRRPYPRSWGLWPATIPLLAFLWLELVDPAGSDPGKVFVAMVLYTAVTLVGMAVYGREAWNGNAEGFAVMFGLLSGISPLARDAEGHVVLRPVLGGLPQVEPRPGLIVVVMVLLGSTAFDGLSNSSVWSSLAGSPTGTARMAWHAAGMLATIALVSGLYLASMAVAASVSGARWHPLAVRFAHTLVPIAFAYAVAHYFSLLFLEGQLLFPLLSDPFGQGWNLIGTADWQPNLALLSPNVVWYVQVGAIVAGHVAGVVLAHDRAIADFPPKVAMRTQYALLAIMVMLTIGGLILLSG
jgi:hypothetical protein